ncbi:uncharacterized protein LOC123683085 [Harmonia axyridis]|uniref:uncharacterized protein LOC123683085 n=1 Tax=Harmonia axyridis TaxID=115357 RepID=UPI001E27953C|nr:uncharacterized protein LOC123683085 [Harmonia axyridis]
MSNIDNLIKQRTILKSKLTRMANWFGQDNNKDREECSAGKCQLEQIFKDYEHVQTQLELIDSASYEEDRDIVETKYFKVISMATRTMNQFENSPSQKSDKPTTHSSIKLPEISIPNFSGDIKQWPSFFELFNALITDNENLSDIQRLMYLKSALSKEPLKLIENLEVVGLNFNIAINTLKDRYDNPYLIVNSYIRKLLNVPSLTKSNEHALRDFITQIKTNIAALKTYKLSEKLTDLIFIQIFTQKLDFTLKKEYEEEKNTSEFPTLPEFIGFLEKKYKVLENLGSTEQTGHSKFKTSPKYAHTNSYHANTSNRTNKNKFFKCLMCNMDEHKIYSCRKFMNLSPNDRLSLVKEKNACLNCLTLGHSVQSCSSQHTCFNCHRKHHSLLHFNRTSTRHYSNEVPSQRSNNEVSRLNNLSQIQNESQAVSHLSTCAQPTITTRTENISPGRNVSSLSSLSSNNQVLLATACVKLYDSHNKQVIARCLTDSASQTSFITEDLVNRLHLQPYNQTIQISGVSQSCSMSNRMIDLTIHSLVYPHRKFKVSCAILKNITCQQPQSYIDSCSLPIPIGIKLADIKFNIPSNIDILLGADIYFEIIMDGIIKLGPGRPLLQNSHLGYLIAGKVPQSAHMSRATHLALAQFSQNSIESSKSIVNQEDSLNNILTEFCEIEEISNQSEHILSSAEENAERIVKNKTIRLPSDLWWQGPDFLLQSNLDLTPPLKWPLARVVELIPGKDSRVRIVRAKAQGGTFTRTITKICPPPFCTENIDNQV